MSLLTAKDLWIAAFLSWRKVKGHPKVPGVGGYNMKCAGEHATEGVVGCMWDC